MAEQAEATEATEGAEAVELAVARVGYAPITRVDAEQREIELCATSEALDAHGTIFDYAASKDAFTRWLGNVREMHERRAVGRRVAVRCDDAARRIIVRLRISRGAQDTWEKVLDGTLRGASIGASDVVWRRERRAVAGRSRWVQVATRYDLAELSLVDNPSNPDALGVTVVRDAEPDTALLDPLPDTPAEEGVEEGEEESSSEAARERQPLHEATRTLLAGCACPRCAVALAALTENDAPSVGASAAGDHEPLTRALLAAMRATAAQMAAFDATLGTAVATLHADDARRLAPAPETPETPETASAEATRMVDELRARVARLEAQPAPGGARSGEDAARRAHHRRSASGGGISRAGGAGRSPARSPGAVGRGGGDDPSATERPEVSHNLTPSPSPARRGEPEAPPVPLSCGRGG